MTAGNAVFTSSLPRHPDIQGSLNPSRSREIQKPNEENDNGDKAHHQPKIACTCGRRVSVVLVPNWRGRAVVRVPVLPGIGRVETHGRRLALGEVHSGREPDRLHLLDPVGHGPGRSSTVYRRRFRRGDPHFDAVVGRDSAAAVVTVIATAVLVVVLLLTFQYAFRLVAAVTAAGRRFVFRRHRHRSRSRRALVPVVSVYLQNHVVVHVVAEPILGKTVAFLGRTIVPAKSALHSNNMFSPPSSSTWKGARRSTIVGCPHLHPFRATTSNLSDFSFTTLFVRICTQNFSDQKDLEVLKTLRMEGWCHNNPDFGNLEFFFDQPHFVRPAYKQTGPSIYRDNEKLSE